jgi:serine/threonine protein kinase
MQTFDVTPSAAFITNVKDIENQFDLGNQIGSGYGTEIYEATDKITGHVYAMKIATKNTENYNDDDDAPIQLELELELELLAMAKLGKIDGFIKAQSWAFSKFPPHGKCKDLVRSLYMCVTMPLLQTELFEYKAVSKQEVLHIMYELTLSLNCAHVAGQVHGDIGSNNIMCATPIGTPIGRRYLDTNAIDKEIIITCPRFYFIDFECSYETTDVKAMKNDAYDLRRVFNVVFRCSKVKSLLDKLTDDNFASWSRLIAAAL